MPRSKKLSPSYLHHKPTGQTYCRVPDGNGGRRTVYLGVFNSALSRAEHARILSRLAADPNTDAATQTAGSGPSDVTVNV